MNYGIVGVGGVFVNFQVDSLVRTPGLKIQGLCDLNETILKRAANMVPAKIVTTNYHDLLGDPSIDVIMINLPQHMHRQCSLDAIKAKKHIYVEKPITVSLKDARDIIHAAKKQKVKLCVGHQRRFIDVEAQAKDLVKKGYLGKVHKVRVSSSWWLDTSKETRPWFVKMANGGGGPMMRWGVHKTDTVRYLLEDECIRAFAEWDHFIFHNKKGAVEDTLSAVFRMKKGTIVELNVSNCQHEIPWYRGETIELWGDKGTLYYQPASGLMQLYSIAKATNPVTNGSFVELHYPSDGNEMVRIHQKFMRSIRHNTTPPVTGEDGYRALEMVNAVYISGERNKAVSLPLPVV